MSQLSLRSLRSVHVDALGVEVLLGRLWFLTWSSVATDAPSCVLLWDKKNLWQSKLSSWCFWDFTTGISCDKQSHNTLSMRCCEYSLTLFYGLWFGICLLVWTTKSSWKFCLWLWAIFISLSSFPFRQPGDFPQSVLLLFALLVETCLLLLKCCHPIFCVKSQFSWNSVFKLLLNIGR